ncbi:MAG: hypothetical protein ABR591_00065 [Candidatus Velthaea sp.]
MTVRAAFAFTNLGGAAATGLRVRFALPEGMRYLVGSAKIDDVALDEARGETALLSPNGADIGEVPPSVERRISIAYLVNATIENGATIELQAALASHETGVIGSNVVRLVINSAPVLQNPATVAALEAVRTAEPGEEIRVLARVHNAGQSSARDVVVVLPLPDRTSFVAGTARIDGRDVPRADERDPFGFARAPVAAAALAAGATVVIEYRARIDSPLDNNTRIFVSGEVASAEIAEFELDRAELTVHSAARFDSAETTLDVDAPGEVEPGRRIRVALGATNSGTCAADDVRIRLTLPEGLRYAPGSRAVDGRSVGESDSAGAFTFERIEAAAHVDAATDAYVVSPAIDGTSLPIGASLQWSTGSRTFDRMLRVRSLPRFLPSRNSLVLKGPAAVTPGTDVRAVLRIVNDGTAPASNARIAIDADYALQSLRYVEDRAEARVQNAEIALGELEPNGAREIVLVGTVPSPVGDGTEIRMRATLAADQTPPLPLGALALVVRSRPRFTPAGSHLAYLGSGPLRPSSTAELAIALTNEGTDAARNVRLALDVSPDARIESVDGATRDGNDVIFGEIPATQRAEATLRIRLARIIPRGAAITVHARLSGVGFLPFALEPVTMPTLAEPSFSDGAALRTQPIESVDAGEAMFVQVVARNSGDGSASRLVVRASLPEHTAYVLGSTFVNDVPLLDAAGGSVLWSKGGLVLEDVDPGIEIGVRYSVVVNTPLAAGTLIAPVAELVWNGGATLPLAAPAVRVRSTPAFAVRASGLPFSVAGVAPRTIDMLREVAGLPSAPARLPPPPDEPADVTTLPRAVPATPRAASDVVEGRFSTRAAPQNVPADPDLPAGLRVRQTYSREALERAAAFIEQSDYGGLIRHLFVIGTLVPDGIAGLNGDVAAKFTAQREGLRDVIGRLFMKMRLPRYVLTGKDLEDRTARAALVELVAALRTAQPSAAGDGAEAPLVIEGPLDRERIVAHLEALETDALGTARPWLVLAELLGSTMTWPSGSSSALGQYRRAVIATLVTVASLPTEEFHRVLGGSSNAALDAALGDVRAALRDALEATATVTDRA